LATYTQKHSKSESFTEEQIGRGRYLSLDKIVEEEGGRHNIKNIIAGRNIAADCLRKGGRWCKYNHQSKRVKYLYYEDELKDTMTNKWKTTADQAELGGDGDVENPQQQPATSPHKTTDAQRAKAKAKPKPAPKTQSAMVRAVAGAAETKRVHQATDNSASQIEKAILKNPMWKWADNEALLGPMRDAKKDADGHTSAWGRDYLMMEFKNIKTKYAEAEIITAAQAFKAILDPLLSILHREVASIMNMHQARPVDVDVKG
jgi:hypothetical protein